MGSKIICGHQPEYLPYLGLIHKALHCDKFVFVDHVQYKHKNFQNRNKIRVPNGEMWLSVPVKGSHRIPITQITIDNSKNWGKQHLNAFKSAYGGTPYFDEHIKFLEGVYNVKWESLAELNIFITKYLFLQFGVEAEIFRSSQRPLEKTKTELLIELCKAFDGKKYLQGQGGKDYVDEKLAKEQGVKIIFSKFKHPTYKQKFEPFMENMTAFDLLFNHGPKARDILLGDKR